MPRPPTRRPARKRAGQYHHGGLRDALIQATVATIQRDGVDAVTLRAVGAALGVSRTALYRHFTDKADLLAAVAAQGFEALGHALVTAWDERGHDLDGLREMGRAYVTFAVTHPAHYHVMFGELLTAPAGHQLHEHGRAAFAVLVDAMTHLENAERIRLGDPTTHAVFAWSTVHGLATLLMAGRLGQNVDSAPIVSEVLEGIVRGLE